MGLFNKKLDGRTKTKQIKDCNYCLKEGKDFYRVVYDDTLVHFCCNTCFDRFKEYVKLKQKLTNWDNVRLDYIRKQRSKE